MLNYKFVAKLSINILKPHKKEKKNKGAIKYQSVVLSIPKRGIVNTKAWYCGYHGVVVCVQFVVFVFYSTIFLVTLPAAVVMLTR